MSCQSGRKINGIRAHRCVFPGPAEQSIVEGIPCTTPSRTLVDLAGTLGKGSMRRSVERAAVLGLLDVRAIDAVLRRGGRRRGAPVLREIVDDWRGEGGTTTLRSGLEARLLSMIQGAGLPHPLCNEVVVADGRRLEVDFLWPRERLVVEADGRQFHDTRVAFERDRERDRRLLLAGYRVARFTWAQIERQPDGVISTLRRLLGGSG